MLEVVVIPFDGAVQVRLSSIVGHPRHSGAPRSGEPGIQPRTPTSGFRVRQEARPGMTAHVSTSPVLDPLAAESVRPCGRPR